MTLHAQKNPSINKGFFSVHWNLISQILFSLDSAFASLGINSHFSDARTLRSFGMCHITDQSPVAAGGIVSFHPCSIAVRLQDHDRLCDSLNPPYGGYRS
jgi:hypothetical protein